MAAMLVLGAVPLLYPAVPPLVDLLGHMGRYRVELDLARSPELQRYWDFRWAPMGNLGVDLLILPLGRLFGLELGVKLIVVAIPVMTVAGLLWVAREVHGRLPPTTAFALPFAHNQAFFYGFVNFTLAMALGLLAFALWLRLARTEQFLLRALLFAPIGLVLFLTHAAGWGAFGLLAFAAELVRQHDRGEEWPAAAIGAVRHCAVLALPLVPLLAWRQGTPGADTAGWFNLVGKVSWIIFALRDRWQWFDIASVAIVLVLIVEARRRGEFGFARTLSFAVGALALAFLLLPLMLFGSTFADMRLAPYLVALGVLAIRWRGAIGSRGAQQVAAIGLAFLLVRVGATSASLAIAATDQAAKLTALDQVPLGARVLSIVGEQCGPNWAMPRNDHLGGMVIARRLGFSNDQWDIPGANLLSRRLQGTGHFSADPSQISRPAPCATDTLWTMDQALGAIPPGQFDYLWLIDTPAFTAALPAGANLVWRGPGSSLYRLAR